MKDLSVLVGAVLIQKSPHLIYVNEAVFTRVDLHEELVKLLLCRVVLKLLIDGFHLKAEKGSANLVQSWLRENLVKHLLRCELRKQLVLLLLRSLPVVRAYQALAGDQKVKFLTVYQRLLGLLRRARGSALS